MRGLFSENPFRDACTTFVCLSGAWLLILAVFRSRRSERDAVSGHVKEFQRNVG